MTFYSFINSSYGQMLLLSNGKFLTGAYFVGQKYFPKIITSWIKQDNLEIFTNTRIQLEEYYKGTRKNFDIKYTFEGTLLQEKVWTALAELPYGEIVSYKDIAYTIGESKAVRGVASAVGHNPLIVIIPCHRVIGSDGTLKGYAAGLELKKTLLGIEKLNNKNSLDDFLEYNSDEFLSCNENSKPSILGQYDNDDLY